MLVTTKIRIDLQRPSYPVVVNAVQGDLNTRQLEISLFSGSVAWMVPDNVAVAMRYCKPDNTNGYYDTMPDGTASFAVSENTVSVLLAPQMLTVPGTVVAQVVLYLSTQTLATFAIYIRVEADPSAGAVTSEDYVNWAQWIKSELDAYLEQLKTSGEFVGGTFVGDVNMNGHALSGLREPVAPDDAATKEYVDKNTGTGAVSTVAGVAPDENGNVPLTAEDVGALPNTGGDMTGGLKMNGHPISGLNEPTENDQAANMGFVNQQVRKAAPRNILDNTNFENPYAQEGLNGKHGTIKYACDRWTGEVSVEQKTGYLRISASSRVYHLRQYIAESIAGKTITVACRAVANQTFYVGVYYDVNGTTESIAYSSVSGVNGIVCKSGTVPKDATNIIFTIYPAYVDGGGYADVYWAALYEGSYTLDTLPEYQPKEYSTEVLNCQRFYLKPVSGSNWLTAEVTDGGYIVIRIPIPIKMRPTNLSLVPNSSGDTEVYVNGAWSKINLSVLIMAMHTSEITFIGSTTLLPGISFTAGRSYLLNYIPAISADL